MFKKFSPISTMHFIKLAIRLALFSVVLTIYIVNRAWNADTIFGSKVADYTLLGIISAMFLVEMILRFFPSRLESKGCQKQFKRNYVPTGEEVPQRQSWVKTLLVVVSWLALNGVFGTLYFCKIIDQGILILISLAYSVCDMICILFFCPFQVLFMKNKCCATCRIYNWDFPMMFTPLVFIMGFFTWGLVAVSLALLLQWEILYHVHPERFTENTNKCLSCANCKEKLCHHKKHIRKFIRTNIMKKPVPNDTEDDSES